jgi:predicted small lipoprotein YifL
MKKLYLLLAIVLVLGLFLTACGPSETPTEEVVAKNL